MNDEELLKAKQYVEEIFSGNGMIGSYCKYNWCDECYSSTKLFEKVMQYHNSEIVQKEYVEAAKQAAELYIENKKNGKI